jgi:hypothetical protein
MMDVLEELAINELLDTIGVDAYKYWPDIISIDIQYYIHTFKHANRDSYVRRLYTLPALYGEPYTPPGFAALQTDGALVTAKNGHISQVYIPGLCLDIISTISTISTISSNGGNSGGNSGNGGKTTYSCIYTTNYAQHYHQPGNIITEVGKNHPYICTRSMTYFKHDDKITSRFIFGHYTRQPVIIAICPAVGKVKLKEFKTIKNKTYYAKSEKELITFLSTLECC